MDSWSDMYDGLQRLDDLAGEDGRHVDAYLDGQAVVMYYGEQAGVDETYRETDDVDVLLRDPDDLALAQRYGTAFGGSGSIHLSDDPRRDADLLVNENAVELLDSTGYSEKVDGFDNLTVRVPPPGLFAEKKRQVGRDRDIEDADRLERIMAAL